MSHFTVMIVADDIEQQLAPFQENNMRDCPKEFLNFHETESEMLEEYKTKTATKVVMPDGTLLNPWDDRFEVQGPERWQRDHVVPPTLVQREIPFTELYATFEEYAEDWCGDEERDEKEGRFGYWENENAKWDWYQVGGRWTGFFLLKKDAKHPAAVGSPGLMTPPAESGWVDSARKGDIDFDGMRDDAEREARWIYGIVVGFLGHAPDHKPWSFYTNDKETFSDDASGFQARRDAYHGQPALKLANEIIRRAAENSKDEKERDLLRWVELDQFLCTEDQYAQRARDHAVSTFALL